MFGIGETELVIIVVFAFMLFGPDKLPSMGRTLGRVLRQFREASDGFTEVVQTNIMDPASEELEKSPKQRRREAADRSGEDAGTETSDVQGAAGDAESPRRETFAERKARLAAERAAREAAAQAAYETGDDAASASREDSESDVPQGAQETEVASTTTAGKSPVGPVPVKDVANTAGTRSAADLYATSGHSSRYAGRSAAAQDATDTQTDGEEDGNTEA